VLQIKSLNPATFLIPGLLLPKQLALVKFLAHHQAAVNGQMEIIKQFQEIIDDATLE